MFTPYDSDRESAVHRSLHNSTHAFAYVCTHTHTFVFLFDLYYWTEYNNQRFLNNVRHVNVTVGVMAHGKLWLRHSYLVSALTKFAFSKVLHSSSPWLLQYCMFSLGVTYLPSPYFLAWMIITIDLYFPLFCFGLIAFFLRRLMCIIVRNVWWLVDKYRGWCYSEVVSVLHT